MHVFLQNAEDTPPCFSPQSQPTLARWVFDLDRGVMLDANPAAVSFWEATSREELLARDFNDMSMATRARLHELAVRLRQGQVIYDLWTLYPHGRPKTVQCQCRAEWLPDGRVAMRVTAATVQPQVDLGLEALRWTEAFRQTPLLVSVYTQTGECLMQNPASVLTLGVKPPLLAHLKDGDAATTLLTTVTGGQTATLTTAVNTQRGGRYHDLYLRHALDPATGDRVILVQEIDTTEREETRRHLERSEALLSGILTTTMDGVMAFAAVRDASNEIVDFDCVLVNPAMGRLVGRDYQSLNGRRFNDLLGLHDGDGTLFSRCRAVVETGLPMETELSIVLNGERRGFKLVAVRLNDGFTTSVSDITPRLSLESALHDAKEHAEAASHSKSQFLNAASQELRTPMNSVLGILDILAETSLDVEQRSLLASARGSAGTLLNLIDGLLEFAACDGAALNRGKSPSGFYEPAHTARSVALALVDQAAERGLWLDCTVGADVPERVKGAGDALHRALRTLAEHALDAATAGGHVVIALDRLERGRNRQTALRFRVSAVSAPGAPVRSLSEMPRRPDSSLKMVFAERLIERLGGRLKRSIQAEGMGFFDLIIDVEPGMDMGTPPDFMEESASPAPRSAAPLDQGGEDPEQRLKRLSDWAQGRGGRLLVVDDSATNRMVTAAVLGKAGFTVELAAGGAEAVRMVADARLPPEAVLMDIAMPEMDGLAATAAIRALPDGRGALPIIAMTAHAFPEDRANCLASGLDDYLPKPVRKVDLLATLQRWLTPVVA